MSKSFNRNSLGLAQNYRSGWGELRPPPRSRITSAWVVISWSKRPTKSTDAPVGPGDQYRPFGDTLGDVDTNLDKVLDVETVRPLIAALPERQRTVLTLRFFENLTQTQIAERIGCSQMHVSRLLSKALGTLRSHVREPELAVTG